MNTTSRCCSSHEWSVRLSVGRCQEWKRLRNETGGEDRTTRGSLAVLFGSPEAPVRGGVSAALDLEVLEDISQKECAQVSR